MDLKIVERELLRKKLYEKNILQWMIDKIPQLRHKEVCHLLLRYIFNKNITKLTTDDPVFISSRSELAETQLQKDFIYSKIKLDCKSIITELEKRLSDMAKIVVSTKLNNDNLISLDCTTITYRTWRYKDISGLANKYPKYINYALALNIRYTYLKLLNHGLARPFSDMKYKPDESTEGFASAFNHYFDNFCSAFPDLECHFGSQGSFFQNDNWKTDVVFVNPPFDECLMTCAMNRVYTYLQQNKGKRKFIFTLPNWTNYPELEALKTSKWTISSIVHKKGELPFIDYMNDKIVYPCDIAEIVLENRIE